MGYQSTSGNGYRSLLYGLLTPLNTVTMVGSLTGGNMAHNHHEGHSGSFITQMSNFSMLSMDNRPNVILLHVGTLSTCPVELRSSSCRRFVTS